MRVSFCFLLFLSYALAAHPTNNRLTNYYYLHVDGETGLSQNSVKSIIQDSYGFMWFGTRNKLNRYDGTSIKVFRCYDPVKKKENNNIVSLFEDEQKCLWIGTDNGIFIFDPILEAFSFFDKETEEKLQITDWVADIQADLNHNIWIVIPNQGLFRYNTQTDKLHYYSIGGTELPDQGNPQCICIEQSGRVWIGTNGGGIYLYESQKDSFTQYLGNKNGFSLKNKNIYTMCDIGDELVIGIHEGKLQKFNKRRNSLTDVNAPEAHYKIIRHVTYIDGEIWVGTQDGIYIINELKNNVVHLYKDPKYAYSLSENLIEKIYKDKENGIWVGTNSGGVNYMPHRSAYFERHIPLSSGNSISSKRIREMCEDRDGNIWIATEDAGINIYNPQDKTFKHLEKGRGFQLHYDNVLGLLVDNNKIWVGFFKNGLDIVQLPQYTITHHYGSDLGLNESSIYALCEDRDGRVWLGNAWGVFVGDKKNMKFVRKEQFGLNFIYDIIEDSNGFIWVATMGNGVYKYDPQTDQTEHYLHDIENKTSLSSNSVSNITETTSGEIWFATDRGGICKYNKNSNSFASYSTDDGLPDNVAYKILEDKNHNLWFGTNKGLVRFNPKTTDIKVFTKNDGLIGNQFNYKSALISSNGRFYFGSMEGLVEFDPYQLAENTVIPPVYITKLSMFNKEMEIGVEGSPLKKSIIHTDKLVLKHNQSNIGFEFVSLNYVASPANKYAYMMEDINKDWIYTNNTHSASYYKLPPGKYTFKVKGTNNDGLWNEAETSIQIEITPPWWYSKAALLAYFILLAYSVYASLRWYKKKNEKENFEKQRLFEIEKEKELYCSKLDFFTNIAHEIRTPVTLINGPLESLEEMDIKDEEITKNLRIMSRNTSELLTLINQLLDFRKVDSHKLLISFNYINITQYLKEIYIGFENLADKDHKEIHLLLPKEDLTVAIDKNAFRKILNNLFSNAIRYCDKFIKVSLSDDKINFTITIQNDGELIPENLKEKIFDPFYQLNRDRNSTSSSGIGLSLARSLTELHGGELSYNEVDGLNTFTLHLPIEQQKVEKEVQENYYIIEEQENKQNKNHRNHKETILIVEDNVEILRFISDKLQEQFAVEKALNGKNALEILEQKNIDLVLSDIMMPEMDGFELCQRIKQNLEYSHIPVVLLTAKNDLSSKIQGLEMGCDAYIEKPFSFGYLFTQINTLLSNRKREKDAFLRKPSLPIQQMGMNKADEEFMIKLVSIIEDNITDRNLNVDRLAEILYMSRSTLHRKIKALSDIAPTDFIRLIRLRKSTQYISDGKYRVSEVCFLVGINSPSYFIKLFQKQFGMTPKEFEKQQKKNTNNSNTIQ